MIANPLRPYIMDSPDTKPSLNQYLTASLHINVRECVTQFKLQSHEVPEKHISQAVYLSKFRAA